MPNLQQIFTSSHELGSALPVLS